MYDALNAEGTTPADNERLHSSTMNGASTSMLLFSRLVGIVLVHPRVTLPCQIFRAKSNVSQGSVAIVRSSRSSSSVSMGEGKASLPTS